MEKRRKEYVKYVVPTVVALMATSLYTVVDGIFVGQGIGKEALAAVNIAMPYILFMSSCSMMLAIGGANTTSIQMGRGDNIRSNELFMTSIVMLLVLSFAASIVGVVFPRAIAHIVGVSETLMDMTADYIRYYSIFAIIVAMSIILMIFVRNDSDPSLALWGMIAGTVTNIFLDWLFIFPLQLGVAGAAIASGLGQTVSVIVFATHFIRKNGVLRIRKEKMHIRLMGKIVKQGLPEFIGHMAQPITILCLNIVVLKALGDVGISAFSVIVYISALMFGALHGISIGIQPLISKKFGAGDYDSQQYYYKAAMRTNAVVFIVIYLLLFIWGRDVFSIFDENTQLLMIAHDAIKVYGISLLLSGMNLICNTFFMSTKRARQAMVISFSRSVMFNTLFIFVIPAIFGTGAIWWGIVVAEFATLIIALSLKHKSCINA